MTGLDEEPDEYEEHDPYDVCPVCCERITGGALCWACRGEQVGDEERP
jgi:hypothetical protein